VNPNKMLTWRGRRGFPGDSARLRGPGFGSRKQASVAYAGPHASRFQRFWKPRAATTMSGWEALLTPFDAAPFDCAQDGQDPRRRIM
jgi:hypothetical protein